MKKQTIIKRIYHYYNDNRTHYTIIQSTVRYDIQLTNDSLTTLIVFRSRNYTDNRTHYTISQSTVWYDTQLTNHSLTTVIVFRCWNYSDSREPRFYWRNCGSGCFIFEFWRIIWKIVLKNLVSLTIFCIIKIMTQSVRRTEWECGVLYNCPKVLETPPQSPDLNIIENLWHCVEVGVRKHAIWAISSTIDVKNSQM